MGGWPALLLHMMLMDDEVHVLRRPTVVFMRLCVDLFVVRGGNIMYGFLTHMHWIIIDHSFLIKIDRNMAQSLVLHERLGTCQLQQINNSIGTSTASSRVTSFFKKNVNID
jgi:hypothetical protein